MDAGGPFDDQLDSLGVPGGGKMLPEEEKGGLLFLSLAWAMQLAAGYPVLTYLTVMAVGIHFCWKTFFQKGFFTTEAQRHRNKKGKDQKKMTKKKDAFIVPLFCLYGEEFLLGFLCFRWRG